jgi:hypothetical protein
VREKERDEREREREREREKGQNPKITTKPTNQPIKQQQKSSHIQDTRQGKQLYDGGK